ncbi:MAG: bifunctional DNA primase/polymerase, partial [Nitrososphaerota archaeon]
MSHHLTSGSGGTNNSSAEAKYKSSSEPVPSQHLEQEAQHWHALGIPVVAMKSKQPLAEWGKWIEGVQTKEEFEAQPWAQADGFAIVCGVRTSIGYIAAIDFDHKNKAADAIRLGEEIVKRLPKTRVESTINNGLHLLYFSRKPVGNDSKHSEKCALELLGKGRICIMAPSVGYSVLSDVEPAVVENISTIFYGLLNEYGVLEPATQ